MEFLVKGVFFMMMYEFDWKMLFFSLIIIAEHFFLFPLSYEKDIDLFVHLIVRSVFM